MTVTTTAPSLPVVHGSDLDWERIAENSLTNRAPSVPVAFYIESQYLLATDRIAGVCGDVFATPARVVSIGRTDPGWTWLVIETSEPTPNAESERYTRRTYRLTPTEEISVANPL